MNINILIDRIKEQNRPAEDLEFIKKVYEFAAAAHQGQKRKSGDPYIHHPLATALRLADMHLDTQTVAAALLHDIFEEKPELKKTVEKEFGGEISFLIEGVTKLNRIKYQGLQRTAESLRKMFLAIGEDVRIVLLKLVDRMHNMETLQYLPPEKQKRIAQETLEIYAPLAYRLGMSRLSGQLEDLAFPYVYPQEYEWLMETTKEQYHKWEKIIDRLKPVLENELIKEGIKFINIKARVKHHYSLYKKLQQYDMEIAKITDIVAMRVILENIEDCYATLGIVHKLWRPVPGKIKDYIALPKPNGYRSLHTTIFCYESYMVEIQIRTREMDEQAEHGIAAHWAYSEFKKENIRTREREKFSFLDKKQFAWLDQIREWQKDVENPDEFLETLKIDFFQSRIFVLSPKGDVVDLPEGATPLDFAYHIHTDIGGSTMGARINGKMVALDYRLKTGEVVEIITQKGKHPTADWLKFVKSSEARKKIGSALKKLGNQKK